GHVLPIRRHVVYVQRAPAIAEVACAPVNLVYSETLQLSNDIRSQFRIYIPLLGCVNNKLRLDDAISHLQAEFVILVYIDSAFRGERRAHVPLAASSSPWRRHLS